MINDLGLWLVSGQWSRIIVLQLKNVEFLFEFKICG